MQCVLTPQRTPALPVAHLLGLKAQQAPVALPHLTQLPQQAVGILRVLRFLCNNMVEWRQGHPWSEAGHQLLDG
jgi:hypothetical protein